MKTTNDFKLLVYSLEDYKTFEANTFSEIKKHFDLSKNNWIDVKNIEDHVEEIADYLNIHALLIEDIQNLNHLPKCEEHNNFFYVSLKHITYYNFNIQAQHLNFLVNEHFLFNFHYTKNNNFESIIERIEQNKGIVRKENIGYLLYLMLDELIDSYIPIIQKLRENLDKMEVEMLETASENMISEILIFKKQIIKFRKYVFPLNDIISKLKRYNSEVFEIDEFIYYNDLEDHVRFVQGSIETFREIFNGLIDMNKANQNEQTNSVMKILTIVTTIFIPLSFIAGLYGMNFKHMPELNFKYSYPIVLAFMSILVISMIVFMKRKKWF
ncbi:MAG: magnesium/cobalt transporter CorA [Bacteroidales bacterium]|nr:magnesium/cobalt transporter CorA [Bacteroidales bacterium]